MLKKTTKAFVNSGMDTDSAPELIAPEDVIEAYNVRSSGSALGEAGYRTNIESTEPVTETTPVPIGINKIIGARDFDEIRKGFVFRYNSFGNNQILVYDYDTNTVSAIYTDKTDSAGEVLLPLDPQYYVTSIILLNNKYLCWTYGQSSVGFADYTKLQQGAYSPVTAEDLSLIKPQPLAPITGYYADDAGKAANFLKGKLFQFNTMWFSEDFAQSAWSTWSKRIIPNQESTPSVGSTVTTNNCIVLSVPVGSARVQTINVGARYGNFDYTIIKSVDRSYVLALTNTSVDLNNGVYEAYDPSTGLYSFVFYNDSISVPVAASETDEPYDFVPRAANAVEVLNGNVIGLGGLYEGYDRPTTSVTVQSVGYNPNLSIANVINLNPIRVVQTYENTDLGFLNPKTKLGVRYDGLPREGDVLNIVAYNTANSSEISSYSYTVPLAQDGDLHEVLRSFAATIPNSYLDYQPDGSAWIYFYPPLLFRLQSTAIDLYNAGPNISKSIHALLDNSSYQVALRYYDKYGRYFPLRTGNEFIIKTQSFAQLNGNTPSINWTINSAAAPVGAVGYQWVITPNATALSVLDVMGSLVNYISGWDANANSPSLAANVGTVGDAYQITTPSLPSSNRNLGNGVQEFKTGDYVVYNGKSWDIVERSFANIASSDVLVFTINPLYLFNQKYTNAGANSVLNYSFSEGDRFTLHYYLTGITPTYVNNPCVDLQVLGYDPLTNLVKVEKSSSISVPTIDGKNCYFRLYSPKKSNLADSSSQSQTIWYEIGERFTITNGQHDTLSGIITDGDVYFKTRGYEGSIDPDTSYNLLATDFNFSDFYESAYTSYGRPGTYYDTLETTWRDGIIRFGLPFISGSKNNELTKFHAANVYGDGVGQTSSSWGAIGAMWMRGNILVVIQATNTGYVPVNVSILEDVSGNRQYAISTKFLNDIRYNTSGDYGLGTLKESFCYYNNTGWFIDPNNALVLQVGLDGINDITFRMSKYLKAKIAQAYADGKKVVLYYDRYYKEVVVGFETDGGIVTYFAFNTLSWRITENYQVLPGLITPANGAHSTVSYDSGTGIGTYTPSPSDYVGNDVSVITFNVGGVSKTKNVCLNWTAGTEDVSPFSFIALVDQSLSTVVYSNTIAVAGNTIPAPISITGGEYKVDSGSWVSTSGYVNAGSVVQLRQTTSASYTALTTATLTIDSQSANFNATTLSSPPPDEVLLTPSIDSVDYGFGEIRYIFSISETVSDNLDIDYNLFYIQDGVRHDVSHPPSASINAGSLDTGLLQISFDTFAGTINSVTFEVTAVTPPSSDGKDIAFGATSIPV